MADEQSAVAGDVALLGLMRLVSPALPVGGFAYSQGLETAVDSGWVTNADQTRQWLSGVMSHGLGRLDVPLLARLFDCVADGERFHHWNAYTLASRESLELRKEELQMGRALWRLLKDMGHGLPDVKQPGWLAAFAVAARHWGLTRRQACLGLLWTWLENQLAVAAKTIPIGQTHAQAIAAQLMPTLSAAVESGLALTDDEIGGGLPGVVLASMKHETQYTRLFRS